MFSGRSFPGGKKSSMRKPAATRPCSAAAVSSLRVASSANVVPLRSASRSPNEKPLPPSASSSSFSSPAASLGATAESTVRAPLSEKWRVQSARPCAVVAARSFAASDFCSASATSPAKVVRWAVPSTIPRPRRAARFSSTADPFADRACARRNASSYARANRASPAGAACTAARIPRTCSATASRSSSLAPSPQTRLATRPRGSSTRP